MASFFPCCGKAWLDQGLPMSTSSNEAVKLYDAALTQFISYFSERQYIGWYDDQNMGGLDNCLHMMKIADPTFVMGEVLRCGLELIGTGTTIRKNHQLRADIEQLNNRVIPDKREKKHVRAVNYFAHGNMFEACNVWEAILQEYPTDLLALKFAHDSYFYLGQSVKMRDSIARVLPSFTSTLPLYGYVHGMHSFGLVETNLYDCAEKSARKALDINQHDAWATHTVAHVMEMTGRHKEGTAFMSGTVNDWQMCGMLACHNFWHWALYHIERGEHEAALGIFDSACVTRAADSGALLDIVDICSLLLRLQFQGIYSVDVGQRWHDVYDICKPHTDDHTLVFNDVHILMPCFGARHFDAAQDMMNSIRIYMRGDEDQSGIMRDVGYKLCQSVEAYCYERYGDCVDLLLPVRYDVINIGGSNAQRDIFSLMLIHAALNSPMPEHQKVAMSLLNERRALKDSPMTDRLVAKAVSVHDNSSIRVSSAY